MDLSLTVVRELMISVQSSVLFGEAQRVGERPSEEQRQLKREKRLKLTLYIVHIPLHT